MVLHLVAAWLDNIDGSFLFDGFPRTVTQAEQFEVLLRKRRSALELAILLELPEPIIRARMLRRLTCSNCGKVISIGRHVQDANEPCPNCGGMPRSNPTSATTGLGMVAFAEVNGEGT